MDNFESRFKKKLNELESTLFADIPDSTLKMAAKMVQIEIDKNFNSLGRWDGAGTGLFNGGGVKWSDLSATTIDNYIKSGHYQDMRPTLRRTGGLFRSISVRTGVNQLFVGANVPYAQDLQEGTFNMPARPFLTVTDKCLEEIFEFLTDNLDNRAGKAFDRYK